MRRRSSTVFSFALPVLLFLLIVCFAFPSTLRDKLRSTADYTSRGLQQAEGTVKDYKMVVDSVEQKKRLPDQLETKEESQLEAEADVKVLSFHPDVKIVPSVPAQGSVLFHRDCIPLPEAPKAGVQICLHPVKVLTLNPGVSGILKSGSLFERPLVLQMDAALKADPSLMLFDAGSNVGVYTLWAAAIGRRVVAVEMMLLNVELVQTSLQLSGLSDLVTIVNNPLYKEHRLLQTTYHMDLISSARVNTSKPFGKQLPKDAKTVFVQTICLDDLIPLAMDTPVYMKMDIENTEHMALAGAHKFFEKVDVKIVQMEWHRKIPEESEPIIAFMAKHGYVSSRSATEYTPVNLKERTGNIDVFFLKKSAFEI